MSDKYLVSPASQEKPFTPDAAVMLMVHRMTCGSALAAHALDGQHAQKGFVCRCGGSGVRELSTAIVSMMRS
jgi:hypothetical protein